MAANDTVGKTELISHALYLVEEDDGMCTTRTYSDDEIREAGGIAAVEATLATEFRWFELLGPICPCSTEPDPLFRASDLGRL